MLKLKNGYYGSESSSDENIEGVEHESDAQHSHRFPSEDLHRPTSQYLPNDEQTDGVSDIMMLLNI